GVRGPSLHLTDNQCQAAWRVDLRAQQVDLTLGTAPIARHDLVPVVDVPLCGPVFAPVAQRNPAVPVAHAGEWSPSNRAHRPATSSAQCRPQTETPSESSCSGSRSTFTSRKVTTRTSGTKRAGRYMSHTHASRSSTSI